MPSLNNKSSDKVLIPKLLVAKTFFSRLQGLMGRRSPLELDEALWLVPGASIHTWFMNFPIDCVFLTSELQVVSTHCHVKPWRLIGHQWGARSVVEMQAGAIEKLQIKKGDFLYVGT